MMFCVSAARERCDGGCKRYCQCGAKQQPGGRRIARDRGVGATGVSPQHTRERRELADAGGQSGESISGNVKLFEHLAVGYCRIEGQEPVAADLERRKVRQLRDNHWELFELVIVQPQASEGPQLDDLGCGKVWRKSRTQMIP